MHRFQPARASSPGRAHAPDSSAITDLTQSANGTVAPELQHLSADDVDILDAVIKRAGPSATTFFTIFKAYSDVLNDRGLDPQEVIYYGKLLKLGTLKGKNWGDKWEMVKAQLVQVSCNLAGFANYKLNLNRTSQSPLHPEACKWVLVIVRTPLPRAGSPMINTLAFRKRRSPSDTQHHLRQK